MQLVQSPHASSLHVTGMPLVCNTCATDNAAGVISTCLHPFLDPLTRRAQYVCHRYGRLYCCIQTPFAFTRPEFFWQEQTVLPVLHLVQFANASSCKSTRVLVAGTNCAVYTAACCVVYEHLGPLHDPGSPGRHKLCCRCCSLCSLLTP